jgi:hypothetical protein
MYSSDTVIIIFYAIFALLALWGLIQAWIHQSRTETIHPFKAFIHLLAFYLSYLLIPLWFLAYMQVGLTIIVCTKVLSYFY